MSERNRKLVVADRVRRLYWRALGPKTLGVRAIVVDRERRVLLLRHTYGTAEWQLPGGGVHRRETIDAAVRREVLEETGLRVSDDEGAVAVHGVFSNLRQGKSDHIVVFVVSQWEGTPAPDDPEIAELEWFPLDADLQGVTPGTRRRLSELASGTTPGFRW